MKNKTKKEIIKKVTNKLSEENNIEIEPEVIKNTIDNLIKEHTQYVVKVPFASVYWNIEAYPQREDKTNNPLVRLEWGWGAGLTDEQRKIDEENNIPSSCETVTTTLEMAKELVERLNKIINDFENEKIS
jgi:hypothetical protein